MATLTIPRRNFVALGAAAAIPTIGLPAPSMCIEAPDPILDAIERCRRAYDGVERACELTGSMSGFDPEWDAITTPAWTELSEARAALFSTQPTTIAGAVAVLRFVSGEEFAICDEDRILPPSFLLRIAAGLERRS
jgi:hypothetical protein